MFLKRFEFFFITSFLKLIKQNRSANKKISLANKKFILSLYLFIKQ